MNLLRKLFLILVFLSGFSALTDMSAQSRRVTSQTSSPKVARTLAGRIQAIMDRPEFKHALFGIQFFSLDADKPIYSLNADKLFVPGSTTKLLTEGTALGLLGADYRFKTRVYRTGPVTPDGTLNGDIVLVASGDPNLSGRILPNGTLAFENTDHSYAPTDGARAVPGDPLLVIRQLAQQITAKGIKRVRGNVLVDIGLFPEGMRDGWNISPAVINDNIIDVTIGPATDETAPAVVRPSPQTSYAKFVNMVTTFKPDSSPAIRMSSEKNQDGTQTVTIRGRFPAGMPARLYKYEVPEPSRFAEVVLAEAMGEKSIVAQPRKYDANHDFKSSASSYVPDNIVAEHISPPLREEIKVTLKVSQNLHAVSMPYILAGTLSPKDQTKTGFDLEREFLQRAGLDTMGAQQSDGAGANARFTPEFMVSFLRYMARRADYPDFLNALPILGRDGTLFDIQSTSPAAGHVHAKTGTWGTSDQLNRRTLVLGKALAGYMTTARGQRVAFAIFINNVSVPNEPDAVKRITGQAVGEIAAAAFETAR